MAVFKAPNSSLILYGSAPLSDGTLPVYLRVNYRGTRKYFATGVSGSLKEWDDKKDRFKPCRPKCKNSDCESCQRNATLEDFISEYHQALGSLRKLYPEFSFSEFRRLLLGQSNYTAGSVLSVFEMKLQEVEEGIKNKTAGVGTKNSFINTRNAFELFLEAKGYDKDFPFSGIDYDFLKNFESYLRSENRKIYVWMRKENKFVKRPARKALSTTSVGIYMRNIRTIWNLAKKKKLIRGLDYPFESYTIKSGTPRKENYRHLTPAEINMLVAYQGQIRDPRKHESLLFWLASYYACGANMADLCRLRWDLNVRPLENSLYHVWYKRTKNRSKDKQPEANITDSNLSAIIDFFTKKPNPSPFVFPVLLNTWARNGGNLTDEQINHAYDTRNKDIIKHMREFCEAIGIEKPEQVDMYTARHSWASNEYSTTKDIYLVSKKLLHTSIVTTQNYLESLGEVVHLQTSKASEAVPFTLMQKVRDC